MMLAKGLERVLSLARSKEYPDVWEPLTVMVPIGSDGADSLMPNSEAEGMNSHEL